MLSQMLWWLAEHRSRVLTIMTTNNSKALPRELYREGRIDAVMLLEGLDKDEAAAFVGNVLKTFGLEPQTNVAPVLKAAGLMTDFSIGKKVSQAALTEAVKNHVKKNGLPLHKG
jgi:AAA+ superfamily predicted ATPase